MEAGLKQRRTPEHGTSNGNRRPFQPWQVGFGQARSSGPDSYSSGIRGRLSGPRLLQQPGCGATKETAE